MMETEFLADLTRRGVQLWTDGQELHIRARKGIVTPGLRAEVVKYKTALINLLSASTQESSLVMPRIVPDPEHRYDPFPLTPIQQAYWVGRSSALELGNVACHAYLEVEAEQLDLNRLNLAWQRLIDRHDMLRAIVLPDGTQQILRQVPPYQIEIADLRGLSPEVSASEVIAIRQQLSHQVLPTDRWPLFDIRASILDEQRIKLHLSFDILIADISSLQILFREWFEFYENSNACLLPIELSFRDYVLAETALRNSELYRRSRDYWFGRLANLPLAPDLPLTNNVDPSGHPQFVRRSFSLEPETWRRLKRRAADSGLTPYGLLLAAFAEVLSIWSKSRRFSINVTLSTRLPLHPQVNEVVGDFTSLIPLEVDHSAHEPFAVLANQIQKQLLQDLEHRYVNSVEIVRELGRVSKRLPGAVLPIVFTGVLSHNTKTDAVSRISWMGKVVYGITQTPQVWLDHQVFEEDGSLVFNWDSRAGVFPDGLLDEMFDTYCARLRGLANARSAWKKASGRSAREDRQELRAVSHVTEPESSEGMLHTLFETQVSKHPHQTAVVAGGRSLTYEDVSRRSNQIAAWLQQKGARPNKLVAVVMEKGWEQVVAVLGILQSGAAYVPIDPKVPKQRLFHLLEHGEVSLVLTQSWIEKSLAWPEHLLRLSVDLYESAEATDQQSSFRSRPGDLAYVIYTSGSTGKPKGVMIEHRAAVNTIADINRRFALGPSDRVLALSALSFDLSVYDIFGTLAAGGTIVMPAPGETNDPACWAELAARQKVTIWNSVPALFQLLIEHVSQRRDLWPTSLRLALLSGDWIPVTLPGRIKSIAPDAQVISLGGATEASIWSILYPIERVDHNWKSIPYGRPMVNQLFHILDDALDPCPPSAPGQLYISGLGLARGYWRDEEKTRASFIHHPRTQDRLYRTGDWGRYLPDGNIEFLGREDLQVKILGHRVELGEIESALTQHPDVRAAVVKAAGELRGEKRLVAYFVSDRKSASMANGLRGFLKQRLPEYMLPSAFIEVDALPLTSNGKVDRHTLPDPTGPSSEQSRGEKPGKTDVIDKIADLVRSVMKAGDVEVDADLLEMGANSVDIFRIAAALEQELDFRPKLEEFYRLPTIAALAAKYEKHLENQVDAGCARNAMPEGEPAPSAFKILLNSQERERFKKEQPGVRRGNGRLIINLPTNEPSPLREMYDRRRSHRTFLDHSISLARFSELIGCFRQIAIGGKPKYLYGSAGELYPVEVYLHLKPGSVEGLSDGVYYYHPVEHRLSLLSPGAAMDRRIHEPFINRAIFDEAAFSIFYIAQMSAITQIYQEHSLRFVTLEAGMMTQLLEMSAPAFHIGLCQIGSLDFESVRHLFLLEASHVFIHCLLAGPIGSEQIGSCSPLQSSYEQGEI